VIGNFTNFLHCTKILASFSIAINVSVFVTSNSTQTKHRFVGTAADWNFNGYVHLKYQQPRGKTKCSANESCTINPGYESKCLSILCVNFHNVIQWKISFSLICVTTKANNNKNLKTVFKFLLQFLKWCSNFVTLAKKANQSSYVPWGITHSSQCGSVRTANAYGLATEGSEFESRYDQEISPLHVVQTGFVAHSASYTMDTEGSFSGSKGAEAWNWPLTSN
jgi:hypothetical protein